MTTGTDTAAPRFSAPTRLLHAGIALAIITQLLTSLVLRPEEHGQAGNVYFEVHEYAGLAAFALLAGFWVLVAIRRRGTEAGALWAWFSARRLAALRDDLGAHLTSLRQLRFPCHDDHAALPSAIHGLGIALMSAMAVTGTLYYVVNQGDPDAGGFVGVLMFIHTSLANLVWAYLIGHEGLAVIQHFFNDYSLLNMWALRKRSLKGH